MKKLLLVASWLVAPALLIAQSAGQSGRGTLLPGQPGWTGQTTQTAPASPGADTGGLDPADIMN